MAIVMHDSDGVLVAATVEISTPALAACIESASPIAFASSHVLTNWSLLVALRTISGVLGAHSGTTYPLSPCPAGQTAAGSSSYANHLIYTVKSSFSFLFNRCSNMNLVEVRS